MTTELGESRRDSRRTHQKSRNGCLICKQRRVKCDERRPRCQKCSFSNRPCSYQSRDPNPNPNLSPPPRVTEPVPTTVNDNTSPYAHRSGAFTAMDLGFLHHAECNLAEFMALQEDTRPIISAALDNAAKAPYLVDQLLALSALHRSTLDPAMAAIYHQQATELQTRALMVFNEAREDISESNHIPSFLFATFLGIHVLRDTLANHDDTLATFMTAFVGYARLHRGVRVVTQRFWKRILESDLKPLLYIIPWTEQADQCTPGAETAGMRGFLESASEPSSSSLESCLSALKSVQWVLDMTNLEPSRIDLAVHATMAWPLLIPDSYIDALYQHRPEALVVFSYYTAILHRYRDFWVFGSSGTALFELITLHVGPYWTDATAKLRDEFFKD